MPDMKDRPSWAVPTAESYARAAIGSLGVESRTAAYWFHKLMVKNSLFFFFFFFLFSIVSFASKVVLAGGDSLLSARLGPVGLPRLLHGPLRSEKAEEAESSTMTIC